MTRFRQLFQKGGSRQTFTVKPTSTIEVRLHGECADINQDHAPLILHLTMRREEEEPRARRGLH